MCKSVADQHFILLNFYGIAVNKILVTELMIVKVLQNQIQCKK